MRSYVHSNEDVDGRAGLYGDFDRERPCSASEFLNMIQEELRSKLKHSVWGDDDDRGFFLPKKALVAVLSDETVHNLLSRSSETDLIKSTEITGTDKRVEILATLLLVRDGIRYIGKFIKERVCDSDLPISRTALQSFFQSKYGWSQADSFFEYQYWFHVPTWTFSSYQIDSMVYERRYMLPFIEKEEISSGGQGTVWKVRIHDDHYKSRTCTKEWGQLHKGPYFAVKEFRDAIEFENELAASRRCSRPGSRHAHLMKALFAFSHGWKHFLILPLARGNLTNFWRDVPPSTRNPLFLLEQCLSIAAGLKNIHDHNTDQLGKNRRIVMGRHGDIKPQNILWFEEPSTGEDRLVLSDFTLMRFHTQGANEETTLRDIGGTQTYRAPETDVRPRGHVSPEYDVWSLGCVFLEFISCYLLSYDATHGKHFRAADGQRHQSFKWIRQMDDYEEWSFSEDKYFVWSREQVADDRQRFGAEVKRSVKDWFLHLHGSKSCSNALHHFLGIIEHGMLAPRPEDRISVKEVIDSLGKIIQCRELEISDTEAAKYFREGKPWSSSLPSVFPPLWDGGANLRTSRQDCNAHLSENSAAKSAVSLSGKSPTQSLGVVPEGLAGPEPKVGQVSTASAGVLSSGNASISGSHHVGNTDVTTIQRNQAVPHVSYRINKHKAAERALAEIYHPISNVGGVFMPAHHNGQSCRHIANHQRTELLPQAVEDPWYNVILT